MIEILDVKKYRYYGCQKKAFLFFFFKQEYGRVLNKDNLALIKQIQSLEVEYKDLPLIGFNYDDFIKIKPNEVNSFLDILVKYDSGQRILYENSKPENIPEILDFVRDLRYNITKKENKDYQDKRYSMGTWVVKASVLKINPLLKCDTERIKLQNILMGINGDLDISNENLFDSNKPVSEIRKGNVINTKWRKKPIVRKKRKETFIKNLNFIDKIDKNSKCKYKNEPSLINSIQNEANLITNNIQKTTSNLGFAQFKIFKLYFSKLPYFQEYQKSVFKSKLLNKKFKDVKFNPYTLKSIYPINKRIFKENSNNIMKSLSNIIKENKNLEMTILKRNAENNFKHFSKSLVNNKLEIISIPTLNKYEYLNHKISSNSQVRNFPVYSNNSMYLEKPLQHFENDYRDDHNMYQSSYNISNTNLTHISYKPNIFLYSNSNYQRSKINFCKPKTVLRKNLQTESINVDGNISNTIQHQNYNI